MTQTGPAVHAPVETPLWRFDSSRQALVFFAVVPTPQGPKEVLLGVHVNQLAQMGFSGVVEDYSSLPRFGQPQIRVAPDMGAARALASSLNGMKGKRGR